MRREYKETIFLRISRVTFGGSKIEAYSGIGNPLMCWRSNPY